MSDDETVQATLGTTDSNAVHDTYVNALHHGNEEIPADAWRVGVVNIKMYGIDDVTSTNFSCLGPPDDVFTAFREKRDELEADGLSTKEAHNEAWDAVDFESRYRSYLEDEWEADSHVRDACDQILDELSTRPVAVVCYEGQDKHCHRRVLREFLNERHST